MSPRPLPLIAWTLWVVVLLVLLYGLVKVSTEPRGSPEASRGLGVFVVGALLLVQLALGLLLLWLTRRQSVGGLIALTLVLAYPVVFLIANPAIIALKRWRFEAEAGRVGDFRAPALRALAAPIGAGDGASLTRALAGQPPPPGTDAAGNDLLAYALLIVRDRGGSVEPVRVLLDAGADPRRARLADGGDVLHFMVVGRGDAVRTAVRLLLEHGADANAVDRVTGETPLRRVYQDPELVRLLVEHGADIDRLQPDGLPALVHFVSTREWETATYLVEKGARLDARNAHGVSVDYYLKEWQDSVWGEHPEGWDRLREAIARRRRATP